MEKNNAADRLFEAVLTLKDIQAIAQRYNVAKMLYNKAVYSEIIEATGASTATISRVARSINEGYKMVFERLKQENE